MNDLPLSDDEFDELSEFLDAEGHPPEIMDIAMLDGFLTAVLIGPKLQLPSRWLPEIWGETEAHPMVFESDAEMARVIELIMRLYNERAHDLAEGVDLYDPVIYSREVEGKTESVIDEWCVGFMRGVQLDPEGWDPLFQSDEDAALMMPMILYGTDSGQEQLQANAALKERHENLADALGICVIGIRDYWLPLRKEASTIRRAAPKVGRNDLCPCGSGKKFKKCCGSPERLH